jgi:hypothetical protein
MVQMNKHLARERSAGALYVRFFNRCAVVALGLALLCLTFGAGLNYSGFCLEQRRYLTDREKIEIAIGRILRSYPPTLMQVITHPDGR